MTADPTHRPRRRRWLILALIGLAQLMVVLDATIVNIALPSAQADLGFSDDNRQWVVTAYALAFGSLLLLGGRLGDLFGRKRVFIIGLVGFAVASALGGAAAELRRARRRPRAAGRRSARCSPRPRCRLLTTTFTDPAERNRAFGVFGAIAGAGARRRPAPRRRADRVPRLALEHVRQPALRRPGRGRRAAPARRRAAPAARPRLDLPGTLDRVGRPVRARLRLLQRRDPRLGRAADDRASLAAGVALLAAFVAIAAPRRAPAAAAARRARPRPRRLATSPSPSSAPGCSASSSSSPTTCSRPSASRRSRRAWPSCR